MRADERDERNEKLSTAEIASIDRNREREPQQSRPGEQQQSRTPAGGGDGASLQPLLPSDMTQKFRSRWDELQIKFVDDPRNSVDQADQLVAELMKSLAGTFACEREGLENQWKKGENISTEDLRVALRRYRSFFDRFLSV